MLVLSFVRCSGEATLDDVIAMLIVLDERGGGGTDRFWECVCETVCQVAHRAMKLADAEEAQESEMSKSRDGMERGKNRLEAGRRGEDGAHITREGIETLFQRMLIMGGTPTRNLYHLLLTKEIERYLLLCGLPECTCYFF